MHEELFRFMGATVTTWKIIGYIGVFMFSARWFIQILASRRVGRPVVPRLFWWMSMLGSLVCLSYFVFGKNDSVGILAHLFPFGIAAYNLFLDMHYTQSNDAPETVA